MDAERQEEWRVLGTFCSFSILTHHSLCGSSSMDFFALDSWLGWASGMQGSVSWWLLPFVMLQVVCIHFLKVKALFSWHSPCNYLLWVWIASPLRLWAPLLIAHGYWTISGLFLKTYSRQMVSFKNSPQITQSQYVLLEPWLIHTQYFI